MSRILVLTSSALGGQSVSNLLVDEVVTRLKAGDPAAVLTLRDLGVMPVPHLDIDSATVLRGGPATNLRQTEALTLSDQLVAELVAADTLVIGSPMYNFGITSTLKAWFDHVLRAGHTFRYTENGPVGLLAGKRAIVVVSRGGFYSEGPTRVMDSQEPHLISLLSIMGISDIRFVRAEKLAFGPDAREMAISGAVSQIEHALQAA